MNGAGQVDPGVAPASVSYQTKPAPGKHSIAKVAVPALVTLLVVVAGAWGFAHRVELIDWAKGLDYAPTAEVANLKTKIGLTSGAERIFNATHPALEGREDFNSHCNSQNSDVSVLGCYVNDQIYIYNINSNELTGVMESTAAHELLHAAWDRLSSSERQELVPLINAVYTENREMLDADLSTYELADQLDELHSRIGTQIADLPEQLEAHYARYFANQDAVVEYYNQYSEPFQELSDHIDALGEELDELNAEIEQKTAQYYRESSALSGQISEFNTCANTAGCFASQAEFSTRRAALVAEQNRLADLYAEIDDLVNSYNEVVAEYNNNVLRSQNLEQVVNSNAVPAEGL